jgi:putative phosphoribosyl transferase
MPFANRRQAGKELAERLLDLRDDDIVVLGLPRGGVPVAFEVARALRAPLDVIVVRKVGVPTQPELAMGAIGEDGVRIVNDEVVRLTGVTTRQWSEVEGRERIELDRRARRFRAGRPRVSLEGRTALIVDDGIATGSTARAACQVAREHGAKRVILAGPVAAPSTVAALSRDADEVVCVETPEEMWAIGLWYQDFSQTSDDEVTALLHQAAEELAQAADTEVVIGVDGVSVSGHLTVPAGAAAIVLFAHGSGSSRYSPRNQHVAAVLQRSGLGTLLFDLLTEEEAHDRDNVFDIELLGRRLSGATAWLREQDAGMLPVAYFGASTGAAAALVAAASDPDIAAVVSRGGRPDLAGPHLPEVSAPTLLIVGSRDAQVLELNEWASNRLRCEHQLTVVPGATHLDEEPGTLDEAARLATEWITSHAPGR